MKFETQEINYWFSVTFQALLKIPIQLAEFSADPTWFDSWPCQLTHLGNSRSKILHLCDFYFKLSLDILGQVLFWAASSPAATLAKPPAGICLVLGFWKKEELRTYLYKTLYTYYVNIICVTCSIAVSNIISTDFSHSFLSPVGYRIECKVEHIWKLCTDC